MTQDEIFRGLCTYVTNYVTNNIRSNMSTGEFHEFVKEHYAPIPKSELEIGKEYQGYCRNNHEAVWNGKEFVYERYKWGTTYSDKINHYEDDDGYDLFIPVKEI